ncbi:predicted protein [Plenodomus lingam JN3]|uniref:Predicted protein n=1 Tax=Leptosphaeria maculans (strain JN3 / isolate v23.1.3 / race Av1-4-5-6-7-8) TaxID=985895 RepID=E4ZJE5_LEPMJ|nr:predicted protein [Plenodomus lingam JN3]CBX91576.1 predicted protein [Plenodomus lingam JN3]
MFPDVSTLTQPRIACSRLLSTALPSSSTYLQIPRVASIPPTPSESNMSTAARRRLMRDFKVCHPCALHVSDASYGQSGSYCI